MVLGTQASLSYPQFAISLFKEPREATGKIVCSNCHLSASSISFNTPISVAMGSLCECTLDIPTRKSGAALQADGSTGELQVGGVWCAYQDIGSLETLGPDEWANWNSTTYAQAKIFGPQPSRNHATLSFGLRIPSYPVSRSASIYIGANRGRGSIYPDGSPSNLTPSLSVAPGVISGLTYQPKRSGSILSQNAADGRIFSRLLAGQA